RRGEREEEEKSGRRGHGRGVDEGPPLRSSPAGLQDSLCPQGGCSPLSPPLPHCLWAAGVRGGRGWATSPAASHIPSLSLSLSLSPPSLSLSFSLSYTQTHTP